MFQLDKLSVIVADKQSCAIRLRGVIISGVTHSYIGMSASHVQLLNTRSCASAEGPRDAPWQRRRHVTDLVHVKLPVNVHLSTVHKVITGAIAYWQMTFDL